MRLVEELSMHVLAIISTYLVVNALMGVLELFDLGPSDWI